MDQHGRGLEYYKRGQGLYARVLTLVGAGVIGLVAARQVMERLPMGSEGAGYWHWLRIVVSVLVFAVFVGPAFYLCLYNAKVSDYLIETQTELRKVSWSPWSEVVGATVVVIVTVLIMGAVLYGLDELLVLILRLVRIY